MRGWCSERKDHSRDKDELQRLKRNLGKISLLSVASVASLSNFSFFSPSPVAFSVPGSSLFSPLLPSPSRSPEASS